MPSTATAQVFDGPGLPFRPLEMVVPDSLAKGQLLVRLRLATICGSDLHTINGDRHEPTPTILGHEGVGEVVACGPGREALQVGTRISWSIADSCGRCLPCTRWRLPQKCTQLFKYGHARLTDQPALSGCYASLIVLRAGTHVVSLPPQIPDAVAAPANCALATMVHALSKLDGAVRSVLVQGAGLLGIYASALLHQRGVERIYVLDRHPLRLAAVPAFGGLPVDGSLGAAGRSRILAENPGGVDAVVEAAGVSDLVADGLELLRPGGTYLFVGMVHPHTRLPITGEQIVRKCATVHGIYNYAPEHLDTGVAFLSQTVDHYPFGTLVSPPLPLARLEEAVELARSGRWHRVAVGGPPFTV